MFFRWSFLYFCIFLLAEASICSARSSPVAIINLERALTFFSLFYCIKCTFEAIPQPKHFPCSLQFIQLYKDVSSTQGFLVAHLYSNSCNNFPYPRRIILRIVPFPSTTLLYGKFMVFRIFWESQLAKFLVAILSAKELFLPKDIQEFP